MSNEFKQFMFGLDMCRPHGGMIWHGALPKEVIELYDMKNVSSLVHGYHIGGMYVKVVPQYEAYTPEWMEKEDV